MAFATHSGRGTKRFNALHRGLQSNLDGLKFRHGVEGLLLGESPSETEDLGRKIVELLIHRKCFLVSLVSSKVIDNHLK